MTYFGACRRVRDRLNIVRLIAWSWMRASCQGLTLLPQRRQDAGGQVHNLLIVSTATDLCKALVDC